MTSLQQVSNWFSSLRRQPKNSKKIHSSVKEKNIHQSLCNLGPNSTFYVTPEISTIAVKQRSNIGNNEYKSNASMATGASTINLQDDNDRRGLVTGKLVSQLCARCCCNLKSQSRSKTPMKIIDVTPSSTPATNSSALSNSVFVSGNSNDVSYCYDAPAFENTPPLSPTSSVISSKTTVATDVTRDVSLMRLPSKEPNIFIFNKRCEVTHTKTTTTTRTLTITRPVELILNEHGEVVARRAKTIRSSSLDCVLDDEDQPQHLYDSESNTSTPSPISAPIADVEDLRFIDDSSNSQSENERNSQGNGNYCPNKNFVNNVSKRDKMSLNLSTHSNNNNHNNLCEACKNVLERNRNNAAHSPVIMRQHPQIKDELCEVVSTMEALDVPEDCKHSNKEKQMSIGRKKFNMDPKKGIEFLVENRLLRHDPQDVAHFLYKGEGLNKTAIGDYLGEKNDFNEDVLKAFVALHDFTNLILVQALRQFLWSFRLPGEAQKIDRMMECFAQRYCQLNPDIFTNTDTCYVLSFAIIMLNTSLHNPSVKDKPTVEQFISMNRGINNGGDLPRQLLESLYESIRTEPFKIPQDDGNDLMHTFFNPDKEGWLWKQGGRYKSWKRRWFILNDNCLYYFEYTTDKEPRGIIPLENISVREVQDRGKPYCFELFATGGADIIKACKTDSEGKVVEGKHTVYRMSAATEDEQQDWIKRLTQSISHNPFYDILVQRKKKALSKS